MEWTIVEGTDRKRLLWYGDLRRMEDNRWPQKVVSWSPTGRRRRKEFLKEKSEGLERRNERSSGEDEWEDKEQWLVG